MFLQAFVFLEKAPVYECEDPITKEWVTEDCEPHKGLNFCEDTPDHKVTWRVDWDSPFSLHNMIEQINYYCADDIMIGLLGASFLMGIVIGCSTLTRLGDVHGRRPIYMLGIVMHLFFMCGILIVTIDWICFILVFIFGMSVTARYYVGYTFNIEMQPKSHYVLVSTTQFVFESLTYLFICNYFWLVSDNWKLLQIPNFFFMITGLIFLSQMPESPRFLISTRKF